MRSDKYSFLILVNLQNYHRPNQKILTQHLNTIQYISKKKDKNLKAKLFFLFSRIQKNCYRLIKKSVKIINESGKDFFQEIQTITSL